MVHDEIWKNIAANWNYDKKVLHHDVEKYRKQARRALDRGENKVRLRGTTDHLLRLRVWELAAERLSPLGRCVRFIAFCLALLVYVPLACASLLILHIASRLSG